MALHSLRSPTHTRDASLLALARYFTSTSTTSHLPLNLSSPPQHARDHLRTLQQRRQIHATSRRRADGLTAEQQAQLRSAFASAGPQGPRMGPFPTPNRDSRPLSSTETMSMRDLGLGQKFVRIGRKSGQWVFVGAGVGIAVLVGYSTLSELFAKNSPTRLYEEAIEKLERNSELRSILGDKLIFYGDHPSARKRRQHRVQHTITPDRNDRQIMTLTFWVESKPADDIPWHVRARTWLRELVWEPSADHFLSNPTSLPSQPVATSPASPISQEAKAPSWWSYLFGSFFASIAASWRGRLPPAEKRSKRPVKPALGDFTTGEVTAVLKQDSKKSRFLFHSLVVDVPERGRGNYRVWVIKPQNYSRR